MQYSGASLAPVPILAAPLSPPPQAAPQAQNVVVDVDSQNSAKRQKSDTPTASAVRKTCTCSHQFLLDENQRINAEYQRIILGPQFDKTPEDRTRLLWDAAKDQHSRTIFLQALLSYCPACWAMYGDSIKAYCKLVQG